MTVNFGQYVPSFATIASLSNEVRQKLAKIDGTGLSQLRPNIAKQEMLVAETEQYQSDC